MESDKEYKMTNDSLIECAESVMDFLLYSEDEFEELKNYSILPSYINMEEKLKPFGFTVMTDFTILLNDKLSILEKPLWGKSAREFFHDDTKPIRFYEKAIKILTRNKKIEKLKTIINE